MKKYWQFDEQLYNCYDESVDYAIVNIIKESGFDVHAIIDKSPSVSDREVLKIANQQNALLITEDKDFGELVFRFNFLTKAFY